MQSDKKLQPSIISTYVCKDLELYDDGNTKYFFNSCVKWDWNTEDEELHLPGVKGKLSLRGCKDV